MPNLRLRLARDVEAIVTAAKNARNSVMGLRGIESWVKAALKLVDICDHKEWLVVRANAAIDAALAAQTMPAWLRNVLAAEAKKRVQQMVNKVCPAA